MNLKKITIGAMSVAGLLVTMVAAHAGGTTVLTPGQTLIAVPAATETGTLVASQTVTLTSADYTGSLLESVFRETGTNFLTFGFQLTNNPSLTADGLKRIALSNFAGFTTLIGNVAVAGETPAITADRSSSGKVVGFNFDNTNGVAPGKSSDLLLISTNALFYGTGKAAVTDGTALTVKGFQPTATPEASTVVPFVFVGLGLLALVATRRKKAHATFA